MDRLILVKAQHGSKKRINNVFSMGLSVTKIPFKKFYFVNFPNLNFERKK